MEAGYQRCHGIRRRMTAGRPLQEDRERLPRIDALDTVSERLDRGLRRGHRSSSSRRATTPRRWRKSPSGQTWLGPPSSTTSTGRRRSSTSGRARRRRRIAEILAAEHREADSIELTLTRWFAVISAENENRRAESVALMTGCVNNLNLIADHPLGRLLGSYLTAAKRKGEIRRNVDPERAGHAPRRRILQRLRQLDQGGSTVRYVQGTHEIAGSHLRRDLDLRR